MSTHPERRPRPLAELHSLAETVNTALQGQVVRVGPRAETRLPALPTGFAPLDAATGLGGLPRGRLTELIGRRTAGRVSVVAGAMAAARAGPGAAGAWVDLSGAVDLAGLAAAGVDLRRLYLLRPRGVEAALAMTAQLTAGGQFGLVVLDDMDDLVAMEQAERLAAAAPPPALALRLGQLLRLLIPSLARTTTALVLLSGPEHHYRALAHAAALRIAFTRVGLIRRGGVLRGWQTRATVLKSPGLQGGESGLEVWLP